MDEEKVFYFQLVPGDVLRCSDNGFDLCATVNKHVVITVKFLEDMVVSHE